MPVAWVTSDSETLTSAGATAYMNGAYPSIGLPKDAYNTFTSNLTSAGFSCPAYGSDSKPWCELSGSTC